MVVIFGGLDHEFLGTWDLENLRQAEWGPVVVDELYNDRDVAGQITAQLITGKTWRDNGIRDRKKQRIVYHHPVIERLERGPFRSIDKGRTKRHEIYRAMRWADIIERDYLKVDLTCPTLFEVVENSKAVYVPGYNPEPSGALDRNILDPRRYPELGVEGALDLREKNEAWRIRRFFEALEPRSYDLLVGQFQYIDSTQHLFLDYVEPPDMNAVEAAYRTMDTLAGEILAASAGFYERVLFVSDNGAARKNGFRPTHYNRPFYSVNTPLDLHQPNIRDFFDIVLGWLAEAPNVAVFKDRPGSATGDETASGA